MYTVIGSPKTRAFRVLWMLEELGQSYDLNPAQPQSAEVKALSAAGKVPLLQVDGTTIADSCAIMTYLADHHDALTRPAGTLARAQQDSWTQMINDELDACLWTAARHTFILPKEHRTPEVKPSLRWEFARSVQQIAARIEGDWLMGEDFLLPDLLLAHCLDWAQAAGFQEQAAPLADFHARARARPAYAAAAKARA